MDKIYIEDLELYAYHGVNIEEKNMGQRFTISLELSIDLRKAGKSDDLTQTVNYAELCKKVEKHFTDVKYDLIEKCAEELAQMILLNYDKVLKVKVMLKKPWAPIGNIVKYAAVELERAWHTVYLGLGSNMGEKEQNLRNALEILNNEDTKVLKVSEFYCTKPEGYIEQDDFINCAVEIKTLLSPEELMDFLLETELKLKRERIIRWGPRTIDIDILMYDDIISSADKVIIPHPRMHERAFVLKPLSNIAPYVMHPILNKRIIELYEGL